MTKQFMIVEFNAVAFRKAVNSMLEEGWRIIPGTIRGTTGMFSQYFAVLEIEISEAGIPGGEPCDPQPPATPSPS